MSKLSSLIRDLGRVLNEDGMISRTAFEMIAELYAEKPAKKIPAKRKKLRKNRETPAEHEAVKFKIYNRAQGVCEGARIRRDGKIVTEHAITCPMCVPYHAGDPAHDKSRGSGGAFTAENCRWVSRQCHRWEHHGGKVVPAKRPS